MTKLDESAVSPAPTVIDLPPPSFVPQFVGADSLLPLAPKKMSFGEAIMYCLKNYANFKGRASRTEYWYFYLFGILVLFVTGMLSAVLYSLVGLGLILPFITVLTRRLHDTGRSGKATLLLFVPFIGGILVLIWLCKNGDKDANRFGPPGI